MTEAEWLASFDFQAMVAAVKGKGSDRLWRLFAIACVRHIGARLRDARSWHALEVAERFADGIATRTELKAAHARAGDAAYQAFADEWSDEVRANFGMDATHAAFEEARFAADAVLACVAEDLDVGALPDSLQLPDLLREIFGNPFQCKAVDPAWLAWNGGAVPKLAHTIYDSRNFALLPTLADGLEDSDCTDSTILNHLRDPEPHVRGCWALDLILGKGLTTRSTCRSAQAGSFALDRNRPAGPGCSVFTRIRLLWGTRGKGEEPSPRQATERLQ